MKMIDGLLCRGLYPHIYDVGEHSYFSGCLTVHDHCSNHKNVGCAVRTKSATIFKLFSHLVRTAHPTIISVVYCEAA
ncbi:Uncharacterised protein [Alysiella crassa]|uniref:Uncharacterized protein n=1 Tax=Alysiella crassa TaxID=153491 RepID=A0A376BNB5_9NEIS|nr:Uncharacterised protein [Alysiella crassa]